MEFHGNVNNKLELDSKEVVRKRLPFAFWAKVFEIQGVVLRKRVNKRLWIYENRNIFLKPNDTIFFWILVFTTDEIKVHKFYSEFTINSYPNGTLYFEESNSRLYT